MDFSEEGGLLEQVSGENAPDGIDQLDLLNKLQRILGEGVFVATYKFALILALAELAVEKTPAADGSLAIPLTDLSERFIILYWRQTVPFAAGAVLHQSTGPQASAINKIAQFRAEAPTLAAARKHRRWAELVVTLADCWSRCRYGSCSAWVQTGSTSSMKKD